jgi:diaminohydroxyphosphoribosylaminopyrimidine deaminase/5-amino-6-(5-phosphoribosylamino)uracil reductase
MTDTDTKYMQAALKLARRGSGSVEPNPAVGAVIVKSNQVIGKGWHRRFGGPHAEIAALDDCKNLGVNPAGAVMYVTFEPCCHYGKTGPCTDAIIAAGLAKVFVATIDPSSHAKGKGIEQLRKAGIDVEVGLCETQAKLLNAPFIKYAATSKCWTILKWAQTIDGKMAYNDKNASRWISGEKSRKDVHKLRRRVQAVLVGVNTVIADDPLLTARPSKGRELVRIVLDSHLRIPPDCKLLATARETAVLVVVRQGSAQSNPQAVEAITQKGAEVLTCPDMQGRSNLHFVLDELSRRGITQLLVEGGRAVITSFLKEKLADEIIVYVAPQILGSKGDVDISAPMAELSEIVSLYHVDIRRFGSDVKISGLLNRNFI